MNGRPVWLASVSRRDQDGKVVSTDDWGMGLKSKGEHILRDMLNGVGNRDMERLFRMNLTLCLHRAVSGEEAESLPQAWKCAPAVDLAGGPIEILKVKGIQDNPSTRPCENPTRQKVHPDAPDRLWIPIDCGRCEPCWARRRVRELVIP